MVRKKQFDRCVLIGLKSSPTPPKFNMEPENDGFQKESPFPVVDFQVNHVKLPGCSSGSSLPCFIKESQVQEQFGREGERLQ